MPPVPMHYLYTLLNPVRGLQFNTTSFDIATNMWFKADDEFHLICRTWEGELPTLEEWVPSTLVVLEEVPNTPEEIEMVKAFMADAESIEDEWEDEEGDVYIPEDYL